MFLIQIAIRTIAAPMTYDVWFLRHVTSNKTYDFCMFSKFINLVRIDLKIGTPTVYYVPCKKCIVQNNVICGSMATKYTIISTNITDIGLPDTYDHTLMPYTINDLEMSKFNVTPRIHWFSKVLCGARNAISALLYLIVKSNEIF